VPERLAADAAWQYRLGLSMVDGIAAIGRVDLAARGLSDFGRAEGWLERQVGAGAGNWTPTPRSRITGPSLPHVDEVGRG